MDFPARLPCLELSPVVCSNSFPLSQWCHPTISSSTAPFSSHLQSFPASESFTMSQLFESVGQSTGASASASVLPVNIQGWFALGLNGLISLHPRDSQESSPTLQFEGVSFLAHNAFSCKSCLIAFFLFVRVFHANRKFSESPFAAGAFVGIHLLFVPIWGSRYNYSPHNADIVTEKGKRTYTCFFS